MSDQNTTRELECYASNNQAGDCKALRPFLKGDGGKDNTSESENNTEEKHTLPVDSKNKE